MGVRAVATITASGDFRSPLAGEVGGEAAGWGRSTFLSRPPGKEVLHAFGEFRAGRLGLLEVRLEFQRLLEGRFERMGHGTLRACQRTAWLRCKLTGQLAHLLLEAIGGNEAVDDAQPVRVWRRQP